MLLMHLLLGAGITMFVVAAGILSYDALLFFVHCRTGQKKEPCTARGFLCPERWRTPVALLMLAWAPLLITAAMMIAPTGIGGHQVDQTKATIAGTL